MAYNAFPGFIRIIFNHTFANSLPFCDFPSISVVVYIRLFSLSLHYEDNLCHDVQQSHSGFKDGGSREQSLHASSQITRNSYFVFRDYVSQYLHSVL